MTGLEDLAAGLQAATGAQNRAVKDALPLGDQADYEAARRGFLAPLPEGGIALRGGAARWDIADWDFLDAPCPDTVHPSLWRMAQLNKIAGLFEVTDGVYQARGFDYANMTLIRGDTGWIVVDPLMTTETSAAALQVANDTLGDRPVRAIIVTHCHPDHFGGLKGVANGAPIYVPEGFMAHAASEGVLGGIHMIRRSTYQFGLTLPMGPEGVVDGGIGKSPAKGTRTFVPPDIEVRETGEAHLIDGVRFVFQMAHGTEAPAEMTFFLPDHRVLCMAEVCTQTMHNALPPRGAEVRDTRRWARVIDEALTRFAGDADVLINSHNWPVWGQDALTAYLAEQRDIYKYTHDQALRLANLGHTPNEIAAQIAEPDWLSGKFHARGYYGALKFNARAVYQRYFGFYDGNPVNIDPLPPEDLGRRYVTAMGGVDRALDVARTAIEDDDLQWAATVLSHVVFAGDPPPEARHLLAQVFRHQGYRQESGILRNCYLTGAQELETGITPLPLAGGRNADLARHLSLEDWFDAMAVRLNPDRARGQALALNLVVDGTPVLVVLDRQVEFARIGASDPSAPTLTLTLAELDALANQDTHSDPTVARWLALHDRFDMWFDIVTP